ncbi:MAG: small, acid-soluble spore protein, alpha/beta type [Peptococcaceae bacterium]|nr:small, acid-soluble spore protein, alpha/beta type [Peptococcaceae bacterium]
MDENTKQRNDDKTNQKKKDKSRDNFIEDLKMEIASELGLVNEIREKGWDALSPRDSGRIGGKLAQRLKKLMK